MTSIDFPNSPTTNQTFTSGNNSWQWDGVAWNIISAGTSLTYVVSDTAPTSPEEGSTWFDSSTSKMYIYYDSSWIETTTGIAGSTGPTGPTGPVGTTGATGPTGPGVAGVTASATELNYTTGVTSGIQGQLDGKAPINDPSFTGTVTGIRAALVSAASGATSLGFMGIPASAASGSGSYTLVASDAGDHIYTTSSRTVTIPANASVPFQIGTSIVFISGAGATTTIAITSDTLLLAGAGTTGSRTLAAHGMATAVKVAATTWYISGNGLT